MECVHVDGFVVVVVRVGLAVGVVWWWGWLRLELWRESRLVW